MGNHSPPRRIIVTTKRTLQLNNRHRSKTHGFRLRISAHTGRATLAAHHREGRARLSAWNAPVLPRVYRMVDPADLAAAIRQGTRAGDPLVAVHVRINKERNSRLVGFVVPKREIRRANECSRVKRQLRHLIHEWTAGPSKGTRVVVRASFRALGIPSKELGEHFNRVMARMWRKWDAR